LQSLEARLHGVTGVLRVLAEHHGEAGALLKRVKANPDKRMDLWPKIREELGSHEKGEIAEVYPVHSLEARLHGLTGVFRVLAEQHGEAGALLKRAAADPDKRMALWPKIREELSSHEKGEMAEVYPVLRQFVETRAIAEHHDREAGELSSLIERIDQTSPSSDDWSRFFEQLVDMVEHHVEEEEHEIFPKAQKVIGAERSKEIEPRFLAAKKAAIGSRA